MSAKLNILQVSTYDNYGGAARVAYNMHRLYRALGHTATLAVGRRHTDDPGIWTLPNDDYRNRWAKFWRRGSSFFSRGEGLTRLQSWMQMKIGQPKRWLKIQWGHEDFDFPATPHLLELAPQPPDILHCHNLHGGYFDLRALPAFSQKIPVVLSLHDAWLLSGHCSHSFECERWKTGCGSCPDLTIYPSIKRDATALNWKQKKSIYERSFLYITTASHWLMDKVQQSMLKGVEYRVIPNGVDLDIFRPGDKRRAREQLKLPTDSRILLFVAFSARKNIYKDYATLEKALELVGRSQKAGDIVFLCRGDEGAEQRFGSVTLRFVPFEKDPASAVRYYQAADIYIHASKADTFPNVILESLACGTPVVATAVGGISEQIQDGRNGFLVPPGDFRALASRIEDLLLNHALLKSFSTEAVRFAQSHFDVTQQAQAYLSWYEEILAALKERKQVTSL